MQVASLSVGNTRISWVKRASGGRNNPTLGKGSMRLLELARGRRGRSSQALGLSSASNIRFCPILSGPEGAGVSLNSLELPEHWEGLLPAVGLSRTIFMAGGSLLPGWVPTLSNHNHLPGKLLHAEHAGAGMEERKFSATCYSKSSS